jgi:hypothetical protein
VRLLNIQFASLTPSLPQLFALTGPSAESSDSQGTYAGHRANEREVRLHVYHICFFPDYLTLAR